MATNVINQNP